MRARSRLLALFLALGALPALARPVRAYVRSVTHPLTGQPTQLYWLSSCETATIHLNGFSDMTSDEVAKSIAAAAAVWGPDQVTCPSSTSDAGNGHPYFQIIPQLSTGGAVPGAGKKSIIFVTSASDWEASGAPAEALALTGVSKEQNGQIVDAEIDINATDPTMFAWANLDPGAPPPRNGIAPFDLQTVMTHEFGHFLGLSHTCLADGASTIGGDNGDEPSTGVPLCSVATSADLQAVMYPIIDPESITKRALTADDQAGVCAIYPPNMDPHTCTENTPDDGCGCTTAGTALGSGAAASLAALALVLSRRRRRR